MIKGKEWRRQRRDHRNFIEAKKRRKNEEWLEQLERDKGMKLFWEAVRSSNRKGPGTEETISKERWREHFRG